jgi:hypothetical protein
MLHGASELVGRWCFSREVVVFSHLVRAGKVVRILRRSGLSRSRLWVGDWRMRETKQTRAALTLHPRRVLEVIPDQAATAR